MRLSDAIMLGRMLLKPAPYTTIFEGEGCALGMAFATLGCSTHEQAMAKCKTDAANWKWIAQKCALPCDCTSDGFPKKHPKTGTYQCAIAHLFNEHVCGDEDWTLDQLIDWVRSVEPNDEASTPMAVEQNDRKENPVCS